MDTMSMLRSLVAEYGTVARCARETKLCKFSIGLWLKGKRKPTLAKECVIANEYRKRLLQTRRVSLVEFAKELKGKGYINDHVASLIATWEAE